MPGNSQPGSACWPLIQCVVSNTSCFKHLSDGTIQDTLLQGKLPPPRYPLWIGLCPAELWFCCHAWIQSTTNWLHILVTDLLSWAHLAFAPQGEAALPLFFFCLTTPPSLPYRKVWCQLTLTVNHQVREHPCPPDFKAKKKSYLKSLGESCDPPKLTQVILQHWAYLGWAVGAHGLCPEVWPLGCPHDISLSQKQRGLGTALQQLCFLPRSWLGNISVSSSLNAARNMGTFMIHVKTQNRWSFSKGPWQFPTHYTPKGILPFLSFTRKYFFLLCFPGYVSKLY